jgi:hypothetical protein
MKALAPLSLALALTGCISPAERAARAAQVLQQE